MRRYSLCTMLFLVGLCRSLGTAQNVSYSYTKIVAPFAGTDQTLAFGINDSGAIVGSYHAIGSHGFLLKNGSFTSVDPPGATDAAAFGINSRGDIVGGYESNSGIHGFLLRDGLFTTLDAPCLHSTGTRAIGINSSGQIVGFCFTDDAVGIHGFSLYHGQYSIIDFPGVGGATVLGINSQGQITGTYGGADGFIHAFILDRGIFTTIVNPDPTATETLAQGINDRGQIAGGGAIIERGVFTPFAVPFSNVTGTNAIGINNRGQVVGIYFVPGGDEIGFLATP
jgi:uncharacterized membrane protein